MSNQRIYKKTIQNKRRLAAIVLSGLLLLLAALALGCTANTNGRSVKALDGTNGKQTHIAALSAGGASSNEPLHIQGDFLIEGIGEHTGKTITYDMKIINNVFTLSLSGPLVFYQSCLFVFEPGAVFLMGSTSAYNWGGNSENGEAICSVPPGEQLPGDILEEDAEYQLIVGVQLVAANGQRFHLTGTYVESFTYRGGSSLPPDPVKEGYDFAGWYYDSALTVPYQGEQIYANTDLFARFRPIEYNVTYNLNGGTLTSAWTTYNIESETYALPAPTRNYYTFDGWYTNAGFTGPPATDIARGSIGDKSYYAKYTPITYAITYELNGGTLSGQSASYTVESAAVSLPAAFKNGYTFGGWYTAANFGGSPVTEIPTGSNGDKIFYARYTPVEYSITYHLNGGTLTGQQVTYNIESPAYTLPLPEMTGYNFKGWYTDPGFSGSAVATLSQGSAGNKAYYAGWELITYTVTFFVDGALYKQLTVGYGSVLNGYYFADSQMQAVSFFADPALTAAYNLGYEIYGDTIIFADTDFELYVSLTYSVNGIETATDLLQYNAPLSGLRAFETEGYDFGGWYYDKAFTRPVLGTDKLTSNITVYAKLTETETVSFWGKAKPFVLWGGMGLAAALVLGVFVRVFRKRRG